MAYCRFSSDNWDCDVYVYKGVGGYVVHVATYKYTGDIPPLPDINEVSNEEYHHAYLTQMEAVKNSPKEKIGGSMDGEALTFDTIPDLLQGLRNLRDGEGYNVPDFVMEDLRVELE